MGEEGGGWRRGIDLRWEVEGRAAMIDTLGMYTVRMIAAGRRCGAVAAALAGGIAIDRGGYEEGDGCGGRRWEGKAKGGCISRAGWDRAPSRRWNTVGETKALEQGCVWL
jgi:hypothetical protein